MTLSRLGIALLLVVAAAITIATVLATRALESDRPLAAVVDPPGPAIIQPSQAPGATPPQGTMAVLDSIPPPPARDLFDHARRLRGAPVPANAKGVPAPTVIRDDVGARREFSVTDLQRERQFKVNATLRAKGAKAAMWVADGTQTADEDLQRSLTEFETQIYPATMTRFAGRDLFAQAGGPIITILNAQIPGVAGYFSESDAYPPLVVPNSNQLTMFFMSVPAVRPGNRQYAAVLAHEFQHMVHAFLDTREEVWINEGLSELSSDLAGYGSSTFAGAFQGAPATPLTQWPDGTGSSAPNYGAAYLFVRYLYERFNDAAPIAELANDPLPGIAGVDRYIKETARGDGFEAVFRDWLLANRIDRPDLGVGYESLQMAVPQRRSVARSDTVTDSINQFAGAYYPLPADAAQLTFRGRPSVPLIPEGAHSGSRMWWAGRGDSIDTKLSRRVDLRQVPAASLEYFTWFDVEAPWDFGYVTVSDDNGQSWAILPTERTTSENPLNTAYGPGITGKSSGWVKDRVDLSLYAGKEITLQFEYVTDEAVNLTGWMIDDIAIPEIGFSDNAEAVNGWTATGFTLIDNEIPQVYGIEVFGLSGSNLKRAILRLDASGQGTFDLREFTGKFDRLELIVSGMTPFTSIPAGYEFSVN